MQTKNKNGLAFYPGPVLPPRTDGSPLKEYAVNEQLNLRQSRIKIYIVSRTAILDLILNP